MKILRIGPLLVASTILLALLLAGGCKEDSSTQPQGQKPTIVSFLADPSSIIAGGDSVTLSWKVKNATGLSISPGVGTVTPVDSGSIKVFVASTTTFTLTASNSAGDASSAATVSMGQTLTVSGYVKDIDGEPISGMTVIIKGESPVTTGIDGSFSVPNVTSPYDVCVILSTAETAIVYQGLTTSNPVLLYLNSTTQEKSATISGSVPIAAGKTTLVYFVSDTKSWSTAADELTGSYTLTASWKGSMISYSGHLQVLRWTPNPNGLPSQYDAYGSKNLTISDGGTFNGNDFVETDFSDPAEQNISGSITKPASGYEINAKHLCINFGDAFIELGAEFGASLTDNFSYTVPSINGATFEIDVDATYLTRQSFYEKKDIAGGASGITITLAAAPQLSVPVNNGTGIDTTTQFLWAQGGGTGINMILMYPLNPGPSFYIFTAANNTTIPNLAPQGLGLPTMAEYGWTVYRIFPVSTINDAASDFLVPLISGNAGETGHVQSETFSFITK